MARLDVAVHVVAPAAAAAELRAWSPPDPGQEALRQALLAFLAARPDDACDRSCVPGHLTASALVLDHTRERTLLTLHPRVGRWIQLGGHCEPGDATLRDAALREATEESGIDGLLIDPEPLHLDVHPITCSLGLPTRHLDVRFLLHAPAGAVERISAESDDLRWWPLDALPADIDTLPQMVAAARARRAPRREALPVTRCAKPPPPGPFRASDHRQFARDVRNGPVEGDSAHLAENVIRRVVAAAQRQNSRKS